MNISQNKLESAVIDIGLQFENVAQQLTVDNYMAFRDKMLQNRKRVYYAANEFVTDNLSS